MKTITRALERHGTNVASSAAGGWDWSLQNGEQFHCSARAEGGWLTLTSNPLELAAVSDAWAAVLLNGTFAGPGGIVLTRDGTLALRADLWLGGADDEMLAERIGAACDSFVRALDRVTACAAPADETTAPPSVVSAAADLKRRLAEAGWPVAAAASPFAAAERPAAASTGSAEALQVELPASRKAYRAYVRAETTGLTASVELGDRRVATPACREAVGHHMLRAADALRFVRAAACVEHEQARLSFGVRLVETASSAELDHALAALGVAAELHGRECEVLAADTLLAERYLFARNAGKTRRVAAPKRKRTKRERPTLHS